MNLRDIWLFLRSYEALFKAFFKITSLSVYLIIVIVRNKMNSESVEVFLLQTSRLKDDHSQPEVWEDD